MSNELLHAISVNASLGLERFYDRFRIVYRPNQSEDLYDVQQNANVRNDILRLYESMGYCEIDYSRRIVYMQPPTLVLLPSIGAPIALLTGSRVPEIVEKLKDAVKQTKGNARLMQQSQSEGIINLPTRLTVEAVDRNTIIEICRNAGIESDVEHGQPAAWRIANFSTNVNSLFRILRFEERKEPNWPKRVFNCKYLHFEMRYPNIDTDFVLTEYQNPTNMQYRHWLWVSEKAAEIDRDWGRYLQLSFTSSHILLWDKHQCKLAIPKTVPLPRLLSRAAMLSSGSLPNTRTTKVATQSVPIGHMMMVYNSVAPNIALTIARKLGQELVPITSEIVLHRENGNA